MKKKSFIAIIAIMIIATTFAVMFTGCAKKVESEELMAKIEKGIRAAYGENNLNSIAITGKAQLDIKKDKEKKPSKTFSIDIATQLNLKADNEEKNGIKLVVKENDTILLGAWYKDVKKTTELNKLYVQYKNATDNTDTQLSVKVPNVANTLSTKNVDINGAKVTEDIQAAGIAAKIAGPMLLLNNEKGSMLNMRVSKTKATFSLPLTKILTPQKKAKDNSAVYADALPGIFGTLYPYTQALGVYLNMSDLSTILPNILIDFEFKFDKKSGALTGVDLDMSLSKKDVKINAATPNGDTDTPGTENTDKTLINIGIPSTYKLKLAVSDFKMGAGTLDMSTFNRPEGFKGTEVSAINFKTTGSITTSGDIKVDLKELMSGVDLGDIGGIIGGILEKSLLLPKDTYNLIVEADIDPTLLITENVTFSQDCSPYIKGTDVKLKELKNGGGVIAKRASDSANNGSFELTAEEKTLLAKNGVSWVVNKEGNAQLNKLINTIMKAVNYFGFELQGTKAGNNHKLAVAQGTSGLSITKDSSALGLEASALSAINLNSIVNLIASADKGTANVLEDKGPGDVMFDDAFILANKPAVEDKPVTPPTEEEISMKVGGLGWMTKYVAPILSGLKVNMFGACADPATNWLDATLAQYWFPKTYGSGATAETLNFISIQLNSLTAGKGGFNADITFGINPAITADKDQTIAMIRSIIGGDTFNLKMGISSFAYGRCVVAK